MNDEERTEDLLGVFVILLIVVAAAVVLFCVCGCETPWQLRPL